MSKFENILDQITESRIVTRYYEWLESSTGRQAIHSFVLNVILPVILFCGIILLTGWGHTRIDELERKVQSQGEAIEALEKSLGQGDQSIVTGE